jgi:translocation and assembly module TamA
MILSAPQTVILALVWLLLATLAFHSTAQAQGEQPSAPHSATRFRVVIDAPRAYRRMLQDGLDLVKWQRDERMTPELLERLVAEARKSIQQVMAAEGYFDAKVSTAIEPGEEVSTVRMKVDSGPRTQVADVQLSFAGEIERNTPVDLEQMAKARERWSLRRGSPFRQADWETAKRDALAALRSGRYASAAITSSEARIDPEKRTAVLEVAFDSGPVFHVGEIRVSGLKRYPRAAVANLNPLEPGEVYDEERLLLYQRRLLETGYFSTVQMAVDPDRSHAQAAPLIVSVIEAPSQRIETGLMYSTDVRERVTLDYSNRDVLGAGYRFRSILQADTRAQSLDLSLDTPPHPGGTWNTYSTRLRRTDVQGEQTREVVVGAAHNWGPWSTPSQVLISAHLEEKDIAGSASESLHAVYLGYRNAFRHTDHLVLPRKGVLGTLELGGGLPGLSTRQFLRGVARATYLWPLGEKDDLTLHGEAGIVAAQSRFGIPSSFLFRTGGDRTVRGYAFESLGVAQGSAIVGGRYLLVGSAEYTHWLSADWGAAVFADAGNAFDNLGTVKLARGYGVGARWRSPVGPFRADVAYGELTKHVRLHFSVGFTF